MGSEGGTEEEQNTVFPVLTQEEYNAMQRWAAFRLNALEGVARILALRMCSICKNWHLRYGH